MGQIVGELFHRGILRVQFPKDLTIQTQSTKSTEQSDRPEPTKPTKMGSVTSEVLDSNQNDQQPVSQAGPSERPSEKADSGAETSEPTGTQTSTPMNPLTDVLEGCENDEPSASPESVQTTEHSGSLDDVLNGASVETDTDTAPERPLSPEPVMWGDIQPDTPPSPGPSSDQTSEQNIVFDSPGPGSTHTSFESPPEAPRPRPMRLFDGRTTDYRMIYHLDLIRRAEKHCAQLIDEKGLLFRELEAAATKHLIYNVEVSKLKLEKGNLSRENDDLKQEIKVLKKKQKHCAENHW